MNNDEQIQFIKNTFLIYAFILLNICFIEKQTIVRQEVAYYYKNRSTLFIGDSFNSL